MQLFWQKKFFTDTNDQSIEKHYVNHFLNNICKSFDTKEFFPRSKKRARLHALFSFFLKKMGRIFTYL